MFFQDARHYFGGVGLEAALNFLSYDENTVSSLPESVL